MEFTFVIYRIKVTFISKQTNAFWLSLETEANDSMYSFDKNI